MPHRRRLISYITQTDGSFDFLFRSVGRLWTFLSSAVKLFIIYWRFVYLYELFSPTSSSFFFCLFGNCLFDSLVEEGWGPMFMWCRLIVRLTERGVSTLPVSPIKRLNCDAVVPHFLPIVPVETPRNYSLCHHGLLFVLSGTPLDSCRIWRTRFPIKHRPLPPNSPSLARFRIIQII